LIYFSPEAENKDEYLSIFKQISTEVTNFIFYHTNEPNIIEKLNTKSSTLVYFKNGNYTSHFENEFTHENLKAYIENLHKRITFYNFDDETINEVFMKKKPTLFFIRSKYNNVTLMFEKKRLPQIINKFVSIYTINKLETSQFTICNYRY